MNRYDDGGSLPQSAAVPLTAPPSGGAKGTQGDGKEGLYMKRGGKRKGTARFKDSTKQPDKGGKMVRIAERADGSLQLDFRNGDAVSYIKMCAVAIEKATQCAIREMNTAGAPRAMVEKFMDGVIALVYMELHAHEDEFY